MSCRRVHVYMAPSLCPHFFVRIIQGVIHHEHYIIYCCFVYLLSMVHLYLIFTFFCPCRLPDRYNVHCVFLPVTWNQSVVRDEAHAEGQSARDYWLLKEEKKSLLGLDMFQ